MPFSYLWWQDFDFAGEEFLEDLGDLGRLFAPLLEAGQRIEEAQLQQGSLLPAKLVQC